MGGRENFRLLAGTNHGQRVVALGCEQLLLRLDAAVMVVAQQVARLVMVMVVVVAEVRVARCTAPAAAAAVPMVLVALVARAHRPHWAAGARATAGARRVIVSGHKSLMMIVTEIKVQVIV